MCIFICVYVCMCVNTIMCVCIYCVSICVCVSVYEFLCLCMWSTCVPVTTEARRVPAKLELQWLWDTTWVQLEQFNPSMFLTQIMWSSAAYTRMYAYIHTYMQMYTQPYCIWVCGHMYRLFIHCNEHYVSYCEHSSVRNFNFLGLGSQDTGRTRDAEEEQRGHWLYSL